MSQLQILIIHIILISLLFLFHVEMVNLITAFFKSYTNSLK